MSEAPPSGRAWSAGVADGTRAFAVVATPFSESKGEFSPDGRWIAYQSNESGQVEIYVQPFPGPGRRTLVSSGGGDEVRWRQDGRELFYLALDNRLMAVPLRLDSERGLVDASPPIALFATAVSGNRGGPVGRHYMVAPGGERFLMHAYQNVTLPITVILNWRPRP